MENYFRRLPRLKGFLDLRSYGQMRTSILTIIHSFDSDVLFDSIYTVFLFVQENTKRCRGPVGSDFRGRICDKEVTWHALHGMRHVALHCDCWSC